MGGEVNSLVRAQARLKQTKGELESVIWRSTGKKIHNPVTGSYYPVRNKETYPASHKGLWGVAEYPTIVCLCGSARFTTVVYETYKEEALKGNIVLTYLPEPASGTRIWHDNTALKAALDEAHLRRIDLADEVLVLNVGGYIGESTKREVAYARSQHKRVRYLEHNIPVWKQTLNNVRRALRDG